MVQGYLLPQAAQEAQAVQAVQVAQATPLPIQTLMQVHLLRL